MDARAAAQPPRWPPPPSTPASPSAMASGSPEPAGSSGCVSSALGGSGLRVPKQRARLALRNRSRAAVLPHAAMPSTHHPCTSGWHAGRCWAARGWRRAAGARRPRPGTSLRVCAVRDVHVGAGPDRAGQGARVRVQAGARSMPTLHPPSCGDAAGGGCRAARPKASSALLRLNSSASGPVGRGTVLCRQQAAEGAAARAGEAHLPARRTFCRFESGSAQLRGVAALGRQAGEARAARGGRRGSSCAELVWRTHTRAHTCVRTACSCEHTAAASCAGLCGGCGSAAVGFLGQEQAQGARPCLQQVRAPREPRVHWTRCPVRSGTRWFKAKPITCARMAAALQATSAPACTRSAPAARPSGWAPS